MVIRRRATPALLAVALSIAALCAFPVFAQDSGSVTVVGSGVAAPLVEAIASGAEVPVSVDITGTARGFEAFCSGSAPLVAASRPISAEEEAACLSLNAPFIEVPLALDAAVLAVSSSSSRPECLTTAELNLLLAPSSSGQITDWSQLTETTGPGPLTLLLPPADSALYALADGFIDGDGLRADGQTAADVAAATASLAQNPDAIALLSLADALAANDVRLISLDSTAAGCTAPSADTAADRSYGLSNTLFAYVNANAAADGPGAALLDALVSDAAADAVTAGGFVALPTSVLDDARASVAERNTGRTFSRYVTAYEIPETVSGTLNAAGAGSGNPVLQRLVTAFTSLYPGVTANYSAAGEAEAFRRFCNGEVDVIAVFSPMSDETLANCASVNVTPVTFPFGFTAVALAANESSSYLACLTPEQLAAAWSASDTAPTTWDQVDPSFPADPILLLTASEDSYASDLLLLLTAGPNAIMRGDDAVQAHADPAYRGAGAANVPGALALFTPAELQTVLDDGQTGIVPVSVNAGSGCVEPSDATIADGTYVLTRPLTLIVNQSALTKPEVQSFLWFAAGDDQYDVLVNNGLAGLPFAALEGIRSQLQDSYAAAAAAAQTPVSEATPEATPEVTPEATAAS